MSDCDTSGRFTIKCPGGTSERCSASQDVEHFRGRNIIAHTMPEEKEIRRDSGLSPTDGIVNQEGPVGERDAGPEKHWEDEQEREEIEEESPREHTKNPAPP
ncbi:hypothetical protein NDU88_003383 [Pleurodeles waltl]|uniref:Uncharacterized protein n=1 Tax=Pleurodeles waltl TaxID=8319 RepID=A0AAV7L1P3_PLEWA|nr:hypothetical protein NDU88_003383 [Pleurodeles waltl]